MHQSTHGPVRLQLLRATLQVGRQLRCGPLSNQLGLEVLYPSLLQVVVYGLDFRLDVVNKALRGFGWSRVVTVTAGL